MGKEARVQELEQSNYLPVIYQGGCAAFAEEKVLVSKQEYTQLKWAAPYWQAQHRRAVEREAVLKEQLAESQAKIRDLEQRLWGKKSEKSSSVKSEKTKASFSKPRGQQVGSPGHGRTPRPALAVVEELVDLNDEDKQCSSCGKTFEPFPGTEDSEIIEIEVQAYKRRIKRKRYQKSCQCSNSPGIITADRAPRLIPKGLVGISVWVEVLLRKFLFSQPTNRLCKDLIYLGVPISQGTLTGGLKSLSKLFDPLMEALLERQNTESLFHGDETGWKVFEAVEGKVGYKWYLWVVKSLSVVYYRMAPGRGAEVPKEHFSGLSDEVEQGILVCDRYSAYKKLVKEITKLILAFCWAHVRRDFLDGAKAWPEFSDWMFSWVETIGELYHLNKKRLKHFEESKALGQQSASFYKEHRLLSSKLEQMAVKRDQELKDEKLAKPKKKVLKSLKNHWFGLTVFLDHPEVPMDNNSSERALRNGVCGRKNYYGSGCIWSAQLAAKMFSLLATLELWKLNPRHYLHNFLSACAANGGKTPEDLAAFLPWEMDQTRRDQLSRPLPSGLQRMDSS